MLYGFIGMIVGFVMFGVCWYLFKLEVGIGYLRLDHSDPSEEPYIFLELNQTPEKIKNHSYILLKVKAEDFITQK